VINFRHLSALTAWHYNAPKNIYVAFTVLAIVSRMGFREKFLPELISRRKKQ